MNRAFLLKISSSIYPGTIKRLADVAVALFLFLLGLPLFAIIVLCNRFFLGRPIFFRQSRPGLNGELFCLVKFRTMTEKRDAAGRLLPDQERLSGWGRLLRRSSLDELPEIWNVLRGDMSLVGPRPLLVQYLDRYSAEQARRHHVKPGITGWAQVNGRNNLTWERKLAMDVWYVDHLSFTLDAVILFRTVTAVFAGKGINQPGQATVAEFMGTEPNAPDAKHVSSSSASSAI
jgi:sugar transferase EpsL